MLWNLFSFSFLTRTKAFRRLTKWAFSECDVKKTGKISRNDFYAGMLIVHLQLAKYCGSAACYPPTREVCDKIFDGCDKDESGTIEESEFSQCMVVCCAQISTRIAVYYGFIILLVPQLVHVIMKIVDRFDETVLHMAWGGILQRLVDVTSSYVSWAVLTKSIVSSLIFTLFIPLSFDMIDKYSRRAAQQPIPQTLSPKDGKMM
jgi:hypothetical protein